MLEKTPSLTIPVPTGNLQRLDGHHVRGRGLTRGEGTRRDTSLIPGVDSPWQTGIGIPELRLGWILGYSITSGSALWCWGYLRGYLGFSF